MSISGGGLAYGLGKVSLWGHSPARDLLKLLPGGRDSLMNGFEKKTVRILLVGQKDMRHVMETLAKNWDFLQTNDVFLEFYIGDHYLAEIGREMILWSLGTQSPEELGLYEKTVQFMEIFGNTLLRPKTKNNFLTLTKRLVKLVTSETIDEKKPVLLDLSDLKFRERDNLVEIFKHWSHFGDSTIFNIQGNWKSRIERYLGTRYDVRENVYDWDYNMCLLERGVSALSPPEYKKWRESGVAFADFDSDYSQPNVTLVTGVSGSGLIEVGYLGEILTGPYIPFGLETEDTSLLEKVHGRPKTTAYDLVFTNLGKIFGKICATESPKPLEELLSIHFLSPTTFPKAHFNKNLQTLTFDIGYFSSASAQYILPFLVTQFRQNAPVLIENTTFLVEFRNEQCALYQEKVIELGKKAGLEFYPSSEANPPFLHFRKGVSGLEEKTGDCSTKVKVISEAEEEAIGGVVIEELISDMGKVNIKESEERITKSTGDFPNFFLQS